MSGYKQISFLITIILLSCSRIEQPNNMSSSRPNILFIAVDDLRPELGCYGSELAITPNIDALADSGLLFERAYCQQAICSPSRASIMTGARPETINIIENFTYFRDINPDIVTLPQHFIANGYECVYSGKIFHGKFTDEENSWNRETANIDIVRPHFPGGYVLEKNQKIYLENKAVMKEKYGDVFGLGMGPAFEKADVPDQAYIDGYNTDVAIATMQELAKEGDRPFFLGLGFKQPHLNWTAPQKYWELYDTTNIELSTQTENPINGSAMGLHASFELRVRDGIPKSGTIDNDLGNTLLHAYLASVSYVDAQIGRMITALEEEGLRENTIIILWSDHGWHLGEMGIWGKATNYEIATRVPLIISTPNMPNKNRGESTDALVELVDIYPTLCELVGIDKPTHLEGLSFAPLLIDPDKEWKSAAFSQFPNPALREWAANPLSAGMRETYFGPLIEEVENKIIDQQKEKWDREVFENHLMGYAMRTDRYRLIIWKDRRHPSEKPIFIELYDHVSDPTETINIAQSQPLKVKELIYQFDNEWENTYH